MNWYINRKFSDWIEYSPGLYLRVQKWRYRRMSGRVKQMVARDTDIMIEGYPRCANSFAVRAFRFANEVAGKKKIATHLHSPAHVILSVRMQIPTMVMVRHPDGAVVSKLAKLVQFKELSGLQKGRLISEREKKRLVRYWTFRYALFYRTIAPYAANFVVADFGETTKDFGGIVERVNTKFNTSFKVFKHSRENVQDIFSSSKEHLYPSEEREQLKAMFKEAYFSRENRERRNKAMQAYNDFVGLSGGRQ